MVGRIVLHAFEVPFSSDGRPICVTRVRGTLFSNGRPNCVTRRLPHMAAQIHQPRSALSPSWCGGSWWLLPQGGGSSLVPPRYRSAEPATQEAQCAMGGGRMFPRLCVRQLSTCDATLKCTLDSRTVHSLRPVDTASLPARTSPPTTTHPLQRRPHHNLSLIPT